jgi:uncharacterized protein DUF1571
MSRILICLPFLLFFALLYPRPESVPEPVPEVIVKKAEPGVQPLPDPDILGFLKKCLDRYDREIEGYTGILHKQERVGGTLKPEEIIHFQFRENPHSVLMKWEKGAGLARAVLFVQGENKNQMFVLTPLGFIWPGGKDPRGAEAKNSARYTIDEFGIQIGTRRVYNDWVDRKQRNILHVEYEGVGNVAKAGNVECYIIHRSKIPAPEDDGVLDVRLFIDTKTWLQVGTILKGKDDQLIGEYFFRDLRLNPKEVLEPGHFNKNLLK